MSRSVRLDARDRLLVLAPHPDDETLATGGLLQHAVASGAAVRVVVATDGDNNPWAQRAVEGRWRLARVDHDRWGMRRRGEVAEALRRLGVPLAAATFLGLPDQGLMSALLAGGDEVIRLIAEVLTFQPTCVAVPSMSDRHPDHNALAVLFRLALVRLRGRSPQVLSYLVHPPRIRTTVGPVGFVRLTRDEMQCKRLAILAHRTQLRLRRHALLAFARGRETFVIGERGTGKVPGPALRAVVSGDRLRIEIASPRGVALFDRRTLTIVTDAPGGRSWRGPLPRRDAELRTLDVGGHSAIVGRFVGDRRQGAVTLPATICAGALVAFVKIEHRFGFFDEGGWSEVVMPPATDARRAVASAQARRYGGALTRPSVPAARPDDRTRPMLRAAAPRE